MNPKSQIPGLCTLNEHTTKSLKAGAEMKWEDSPEQKHQDTDIRKALDKMWQHVSSGHV